MLYVCLFLPSGSEAKIKKNIWQNNAAYARCLAKSWALRKN